MYRITLVDSVKNNVADLRSATAVVTSRVEGAYGGYAAAVFSLSTGTAVAHLQVPSPDGKCEINSDPIFSLEMLSERAANDAVVDFSTVQVDASQSPKRRRSREAQNDPRYDSSASAAPDAPPSQLSQTSSTNALSPVRPLAPSRSHASSPVASQLAAASASASASPTVSQARPVAPPSSQADNSRPVPAMRSAQNAVAPPPEAPLSLDTRTSPPPSLQQQAQPAAVAASPIGPLNPPVAEQPFPSHVQAQFFTATAATPSIILHPIATQPATVAEHRAVLHRISFLLKEQIPHWAAAYTTIVAGWKHLTPTQKSVALRAVLMAPAILLPQTNKRLANRTIGRIASAQEIADAPFPAQRPVVAGNAETKLLNHVSSLAIAGLEGAAVKKLMRPISTHKLTEEEAVTGACALNPRRVEDIVPCTPSGSFQVTIKRKPAPKAQSEASSAPRDSPFKAYIKSCCGGKSPGPSGLSEELFYNAITAGNEADIIAMINDIVNGNLDDDSYRLLRQGILVAIPKKPDGIRPLVMGEVLPKIAAKLVLKSEPALYDSNAVGSFQYAFQQDGPAQIIHHARAVVRTDEGVHMVLVDCRNAFNTVRRKPIRDYLMSSNLFNPLRQLFNHFYVEQGDLIVRGTEIDHPVISSSEGVRQGDVLGPLFFCYALKPAIEKTQAIFSSRFPDKPVEFHAYMDDVTIIGDEDTCIQAFEILKHELLAISLVVNESKTVTTSERVKDALGCKHSDCPKLLGSFVSKVMSKELEAIDGLPECHEVFFNRISKLPAEIAFRLLRHCGVPRWAHIIRTHAPEVSMAASKDFTEMATRCLANILCIPYESITPAVLRQIYLPIRFGGMGMMAWEEMAHDAYRASLSGDTRRSRREEIDEFAPTEATEDEKHARNVFWETLLEELDPELRAHLKRNAHDACCKWLTAPLTHESVHSSNHFRAAMLFRLGWAGAHPDAPTSFQCACGFPSIETRATTFRHMLEHAAGCTNSGAPTERHHLICNQLKGALTDAGYSCRSEVTLEPTDPQRGLRMDIVAHPLGDGEKLYIDTTIVNTMCRTHKGKKVCNLLKTAHEDKVKLYGAAAARDGYTYMTFGMDVYGSKSLQTMNFIAKLATAAKTRAPPGTDPSSLTSDATTLLIHRALALGNGQCLVNSRFLEKMRVNFSLSSPPIVAPSRNREARAASAADHDNTRDVPHTPPTPEAAHQPPVSADLH